MQVMIKLLLGIAVLLLGIPVGNLLAKATNDELKAGKKWFRIIVIMGLIGAVISLIFRNDALLFTFLFIVIVTNKSLRR
ncbi:hypothetical protein A3K82_01660 [Candidatus Pacearchaeota archaeon RBG_19FT_COMBO_34_9]|nr:MAG: hypothetical protein A3K82_01660 [Candidatus Pacearchaeota archaeon RBG_19FT_COMBO_34_9]OGJ16756.1 MAG: hypothetical protein A3K74_00890 [Candidatus Pacearchaeota archaeon RBG_13_33_26]